MRCSLADFARGETQASILGAHYYRGLGDVYNQPNMQNSVDNLDFYKLLVDLTI